MTTETLFPVDPNAKYELVINAEQLAILTAALIEKENLGEEGELMLASFTDMPRDQSANGSPICFDLTL